MWADSRASESLIIMLLAPFDDHGIIICRPSRHLQQCPRGFYESMVQICSQLTWADSRALETSHVNDSGLAPFDDHGSITCQPSCYL